MTNTTAHHIQTVGKTTVVPTGDAHAKERLARLDARTIGIKDLAEYGWRLISTVQIPAESTVTIADVFERILTD